MKILKLFGAAFALVVLLAPSAHAVVYGVKTCGSGSASCANGLGVFGGGSLAPSLLFSFAEIGSGINSIAIIQTVTGADIDIDGLAFSGAALFGFGLSHNNVPNVGGNLVPSDDGSQLMSIDTSTGVATAIGSNNANLDVRGAAFAGSGNLWTVDSAGDQLVRIDPATGNILQTVALSQAVSTGVDLAFRADGTAFIADFGNIFTVDIGTGTMTLVASDPSIGYAGIAFSDNAVSDVLFGYEVFGQEDIDVFNTATLSTNSGLYSNIFPNLNGFFNAGRGDLAAFVTSTVVPVPAALPLFAGGLGLLGLFGWCRKRNFAV